MVAFWQDSVVATSSFVLLLIRFGGCDIAGRANHQPVRKTKYGEISGYQYEVNGFKADVFEAVPFAKPPVGKLRFENPQEPADWTVRRNCTRPSNWCIQFWYGDPRVRRRTQDEDCLYLRVITPSKISKKYPVLLWFHGGSYQVNGANMFPVYTTISNIVSQGIVVVYPNYRLGPLGFMSTLSADFAGNYGLEDMAMASKWVNENIGYFGGDPDNVTVGGESAGGSAVSLLVVSPRTKHLFARAVLRSGSSLAPWSVRSDNTDLNSKSIMRWSGCDMARPYIKRVKKCLQATNVTQLMEYWLRIGNLDLMYILSSKKYRPRNKNHPLLAHTYFTPVVDGHRLKDSLVPMFPQRLIQENARIPVMLGVTTGECSSYITWLYHLLTQNISVDLKDLDFVIPFAHYANSEQIKQATYRHYVIDRLFANLEFSYSKTLVQIASDQNFVGPAVQEAMLYAHAKQPVFAYIFDHSNEQLGSQLREYGLDDVGAGHGYDMVFLYESTVVLDPTGSQINLSLSDRYVNEFLSKTLAAFVKTGNPTVGSLPSYWPPYSSLDCGQALRIGAAPKLVPFATDVYRFWYDTIRLLDSLTFAKNYRFLGDDQDAYNRLCLSASSTEKDASDEIVPCLFRQQSVATLLLFVYVLLVLFVCCFVGLIVACYLLRTQRTVAGGSANTSYRLTAGDGGDTCGKEVKI